MSLLRVQQALRFGVEMANFEKTLFKIQNVIEHDKE